MKKKLLSIIASGLMLASVQVANAQTGAALNFDGTNDYVSVPDKAVLNFGTGDFTIEADFQSSASQPDYTGIVAKDGSSAGLGWQLVVVGNNIAAEFTDGNTFFGAGGPGMGLQGSIALNDGNWHNLAMVVSRSNASITLYVDGVVDAFLSDPAIGTMNISNPTVPMLIGVDRTTSIFANGNIDEVRIWNIARTQTAIQNNMSCAIAPNAAGLVAYYNFDNGIPNGTNTSITTTPDATTNANTGTLNNFALTVGTTSNFVGNESFTTSPAVTTNLAVTVCAGTTSTLTATAPTATSYSWSTSATTASITATPTTTTYYTVLVTDANNCANWTIDTVNVNALPTVTANSATVCIGTITTTTLMATAPTATSYSWNTSATTASITATPTVTTHYTVTVTDGNNCINWATDSVVISNLPTVTANSATVCAGTTATLTATAPTATSYSWSTSATTASVTATPTLTTHYTVTVTDANNCINWVTDSIKVNILPTVTASSKTVCAGNTATLTATAPTATSYSWNTSATTASITATPTLTTHYTVTVMDVNNCTNWATDSITVKTLPTLTITSTSGYTVCPATTDTLKASGTATSYTWSPGNHAVTDYTVRPFGNTTYTLTGVGANGCTSKLTQSITVYPRPTLTVTASAQPICVGATTTLSVVTGTVSITSYSWSTSATTTTISVNPVITTTYAVTGFDAQGCTGRARYTLTVNPLPIVTATSDSVGTVCKGRAVVITAGGATTYTWSNSATTPTIAVTPTTTTTYTVMGTDGNGCENMATVTQSVSTTCIAGIENYNNDANVTLYPNPNNSTFVVTTTELAKTILVTDILGNQLLSIKPTDNTTTISLNMQANGIYFVKIISNNAQTVKRFVITN